VKLSKLTKPVIEEFRDKLLQTRSRVLTRTVLELANELTNKEKNSILAETVHSAFRKGCENGGKYLFKWLLPAHFSHGFSKRS
jgi:hypothetical protein